MTTTEKIENRIIAEIEKGAPTFREAAERAAWKATKDAEAMGWPESTILGVTVAFANVAADMLARTLEATGR